MDNLFNINTLQLLILFFVPGFISIKVFDLLVPGERRDFTKAALDAIAYSCTNFALLFWLILLANQDEFSTQHQVAAILINILILFAFPILWPILLKTILDSRFLKGRIVPRTPKAWDHFFGKFGSRGSFFILIHLKNGDIIGGLWSGNSFASSYPHEQEIYIEEVWKINESGEFIEKVAQSAGMLIRDTEVDYYEFFQSRPDEEVTHEG